MIEWQRDKRIYDKRASGKFNNGEIVHRRFRKITSSLRFSDLVILSAPEFREEHDTSRASVQGGTGDGIATSVVEGAPCL